MSKKIDKKDNLVVTLFGQEFVYKDMKDFSVVQSNKISEAISKMGLSRNDAYSGYGVTEVAIDFAVALSFHRDSERRLSPAEVIRMDDKEQASVIEAGVALMNWITKETGGKVRVQEKE